MRILLLTLRGDIIGDSIRELSLIKKIKKENKDAKIIYPCTKVVYQILRENKEIEELVLIPLFQNLTNKNISKIKKLHMTISGINQIKKYVMDVDKVIYVGKKYIVREILAKKLAKYYHAKFEKSGFEEASQYNAQISFTKKEENDILKKYFKNFKKKRIAVDIESNDLKRCWDVRNYEKVIEELLKKYRVYLVGIEKDYNEFLLKRFKNNKNFVYLIGKTNLRESSLIVKNCDYFIGNDSGLAHISAAVNTNMIVITIADTIQEKMIYNNKKKSFVKVLRNPSINEVIKNVK